MNQIAIALATVFSLTSIALAGERKAVAAPAKMEAGSINVTKTRSAQDQSSSYQGSTWFINNMY